MAATLAASAAACFKSWRPSGAKYCRLCCAEAKVGLIEFLQNCSDIKISVPCNVLGKYSQQSTSRVEVGVNGSCGDDILLDCGSFWKGAPSYLVRMHYGELLSYANKTTISTIIKKLQSKGLIQVSPTFTRPQIGNRPISRQSITREVITSNQSLSPGLSKREQGVHASKDTAFHDHRGVRRSGINLPEGHSRKGFSTPAKGHNDCVIDEHTSFPGAPRCRLQTPLWLPILREEQSRAKGSLQLCTIVEPGRTGSNKQRQQPDPARLRLAGQPSTTQAILQLCLAYPISPDTYSNAHPARGGSGLLLY